MKWMEKVDPDLRRLYRYFLPHKWRLAVAVVFLMGSASMSSVTATLLGKMTDIGFYHQEGWNIYAAPLALIGVTLGFAICTVMSTVLMAKVSQAVLVKLRMQLFESILHWPDAEYQRNTTGRISSKFVNEATMALSGAAPASVASMSLCFQHCAQSVLRTDASMAAMRSFLPLIFGLPTPAKTHSPLLRM